MESRRGLEYANTRTDITAWFPALSPEDGIGGVGEGLAWLDAPAIISFRVNNVFRLPDGGFIPYDSADVSLEKNVFFFLLRDSSVARAITSPLLYAIRELNMAALDFLGAEIAAFAAKAAWLARLNGRGGFSLDVRVDVRLSSLFIDAAASGSGTPRVLVYRASAENECPFGIVDRLPTVELEKGRSESDETECSICLLDFEPGTELKKTACSHLFHRHCLLRWLFRRRSCPMCRAEIATAAGTN